MELEPAFRPPLGRSLQREPSDRGTEPVRARITDALVHAVELRAGRSDARTDVPDVGPVPLLADGDVEARPLRRRPLTERVEQLVFVVDGPQPHEVVGDVVEPLAQLVVGGLAVDACRAHVVDRVERAGDERGHRRRLRRVRGTRSSTRSQFCSNAQASASSAAGPTPVVSRSSSVRSRSRSSSMSSRNALQRRSNSTPELTSSSTSTRGGSPASMGCSESSRCANECSVPIAAPSSWSSAVRQRCTTSGSGSAVARSCSFRRMRSRSSAPAFSVKVIAAISRNSATPLVTSATTRATSAVVLPDPAPASTNRVPVRSRSMRSRAASSASSGTRKLPLFVLDEFRVDRLGELARTSRVRGRGACAPTRCAARSRRARRGRSSSIRRAATSSSPSDARRTRLLRCPRPSTPSVSPTWARTASVTSYPIRLKLPLYDTNQYSASTHASGVC